MIPVVVLDILTVWQWIRRITLGAMFAGGLALAIFHCSGCGAGALQAHATAAHVTGIFIDGAHDIAEAHLTSEMAPCIEAEDDACADRVADAQAPISAGLASAEAAWSTWVSAIEIAHLSGSSEGLIEALASMARRALRSYAALGEAFAGVGLALPPVPDMVLSFVGGEP